MIAAAVAGSLAGFALGYAVCRCRERRVRLRTGRMLSFVAHELNTPLTAVNMTVLNFISGVFGTLDKDQQDWMAMMREQVARLNGLVGELRDFIHLEFQCDLNIRPEPSDLRKCLTAVLAQFQGTTARSGGRIDLKVPDVLPQVQADPDRLQRALGSVLAHARKFRKDGPGPIAISALVEPSAVELRIAYAANTLPAGDPERMLDLYYPISAGGSSQLLSSVGTGLGLCRILLEMQGGSLHIGLGEGGQIELRLRLARA